MHFIKVGVEVAQVGLILPIYQILEADMVSITDKKIVGKFMLGLIIGNDMSQLLKKSFSNMNCNDCIFSLYFDYKLVTAAVIAEVTATAIAY